MCSKGSRVGGVEGFPDYPSVRAVDWVGRHNESLGNSDTQHRMVFNDFRSHQAASSHSTSS